MRNRARQYALCIASDDPGDIEPRKVYEVLPDERGQEVGLIRVIDESGEDYLYPVRWFVPIALPREAERALGPRPKETRSPARRARAQAATKARTAVAARARTATR